VSTQRRLSASWGDHTTDKASTSTFQHSRRCGLTRCHRGKPRYALIREVLYTGVARRVTKHGAPIGCSTKSRSSCLQWIGAHIRKRMSDVSQWSKRELLALHVALSNELRVYSLTRSSNNPTSETSSNRVFLLVHNKRFRAVELRLSPMLPTPDQTSPSASAGSCHGSVRPVQGQLKAVVFFSVLPSVLSLILAIFYIEKSPELVCSRSAALI
jgi:hypothetical protein